MNKAIYPGTFDPPTLGHLDVARRAAKVCDHLTIAVARSTRKNTWFPLEERVRLVTESVEGVENVTVVSFDGLLVDFARSQGIHVIMRGLRAFSDFEYEFQMALGNRKLAPDLETVFLMTSETYSYISSTTVREVWRLGGNTTEFVPPCVQRTLDRLPCPPDR
jgi:pantetheine-phosphate adenylyltransferase